ncbi:MAG: hypothetical protein IKJ63_05315 [Clostridia bacterium]|nr:hypothetical protein [Clostridia bacterium]
MKLFQKSLSVLLTAVLLLTACLPAFSGAAAVVAYEEQYKALATLLADEHVRDLNHYEVESQVVDDVITEGFNTEAGAFTYYHTVYAEDNAQSAILKAANRFYYIAESLMSYTYGNGIYTAELLYKEVLGNLESCFADMFAEAFYVDARGNRYAPTETELAAYAEACRQLAAENVAQPTFAQLAERGVKFAEVSAYEYYNVETVISYFMATGTYITSANWYHEFDFIVRTDMDTVLLAIDSLATCADTDIAITTGIYSFRYQRGVDSLGSTAQYCFKPTELADIYAAYSKTYALGAQPAALAFVGQDSDAAGQAANLYTAIAEDTATIPELIAINNAFNAVFTSVPADAYIDGSYVGKTWDSQFLQFADDELNTMQEGTFSIAGQDLYTLRGYAEKLTNNYSDAVVLHLFADTIGNIKTLQNLLTSSQQIPVRTVRGDVTYTADIEKLNFVVTELDELLRNEDVTAFGNIFFGAAVRDFLGIAPDAALPYNNIAQLGELFVKKVLYTDAFCTTIVQVVYPKIANLFLALFESDAERLAAVLQSDVVALTPGKLADDLAEYPAAKIALEKAGMNDWNTVDWAAIDWTKNDGTPLNSRDAFVDALAAVFSGLHAAALCLLCNDNTSLCFNIDDLSLAFDGQTGYADLIIPLFEVLGLAPASANEELTAGYYYTADVYAARATTETYVADILLPILMWLEEIVVYNPIATICALLPDLAKFFSSENEGTLLACLKKIKLTVKAGDNVIGEADLVTLLGDTAKVFDSLNHLAEKFAGLFVNNGIAYSLPKLNEEKLAKISAMTENKTGYAFLYLMRYVLTAIGYRFDVTNPNLPYLVECFGINLESELFEGVTVADFVCNVMLHPDEALCALLEFVYPNEEGNYYNKKAYTYSLNPIDYRTDTLWSVTLNPNHTYGTKVVYSDMWTAEMAGEVVADLDQLTNNVLRLLGVKGMENGLEAYLRELIYGYISNETVNKLFNLIYQLLCGVNGTVGGVDLIALIDHSFGVEITPALVASRVTEMLGDVSVDGAQSYKNLAEFNTWTDVFNDGQSSVSFDWGVDKAKDKGETFIRVLSALLSPISFLFEYLLLDQPLQAFDFACLPSYAGYQYAFIALLELLTCPAEKILTYKTYYEQTILQKETNPDRAECNTFYYLLSPVLGLVDKLIETPIATVFNLLPNLMFVMSTGAINDLINNLLHVVYVLFDIAKPVVNMFDILDELFSDISFAGVKLNLNLPLQINFNTVADALISSVLGETIVIGTREVTDENGNVTTEDILLTLPYIDFYTLCTGSLERFASKEGRKVVRLNASGGGDLLTVLLRLAVSVFFVDGNLSALLALLFNISPKLDEYDKETVSMLLGELGGMMEDFDSADIVLLVLYHLVTKVTDLSTTLVDLLADSGITILELVAILGSIKSVDDLGIIIDLIGSLGEKQDPPADDDDESGESGEPGEGADGDEGEQPPADKDEGGPLDVIMSLFDKLKAFFDKLILFLKKSFGMA